MKPPNATNAEASRIIARLRSGEKEIVAQLYDQHRAQFLAWATRRFVSTPGDIEDAWQEAVIVFFELVRSGRLTELTCSVKTFLFALGYKWMLKLNRKMKRIRWKGGVEEAIGSNAQLQAIRFDDDPWEEERYLLKTAMEQLTPKCREILRLRHYEELAIEELVEFYQKKHKENPDNIDEDKEISRNNVSSQLSQCLRKLKEIIKDLPPK